MASVLGFGLVFYYLIALACLLAVAKVTQCQRTYRALWVAAFVSVLVIGLTF